MFTLISSHRTSWHFPTLIHLLIKSASNFRTLGCTNARPMKDCTKTHTETPHTVSLHHWLFSRGRSNVSTGPPGRRNIDPSKLGSSRWVHQSDDIWSFGCVTLEFAQWLVFGRTGALGLEGFRENRRSETRHVPGLDDDDVFHDNEKALASVRYSMAAISQGKRSWDVVTDRILSMLRNMITPKDRISAQECYTLAQKEIYYSEEEIKQRMQASSSLLQKAGSNANENSASAVTLNYFQQSPWKHVASPLSSARPLPYQITHPFPMGHHEIEGNGGDSGDISFESASQTPPSNERLPHSPPAEGSICRILCFVVRIFDTNIWPSR